MTRATLSADSRVSLGPETQAALAAAQGDRCVAARALGIEPRMMRRRILECVLAGEPLRTWVAREWPSRGGRTSVAVWTILAEPGVRVYVLDAHGEHARGAHVVRVPAVGVRRSRVVCKVCKEART